MVQSATPSPPVPIPKERGVVPNVASHISIGIRAGRNLQEAPPACQFSAPLPLSQTALLSKIADFARSNICGFNASRSNRLCH